MSNRFKTVLYFSLKTNIILINQKNGTLVILKPYAVYEKKSENNIVFEKKINDYFKFVDYFCNKYTEKLNLKITLKVSYKNGQLMFKNKILISFYFLGTVYFFYKLINLDQGSADNWCSRAKFEVFKIFAGRSLSFSEI